VAALLALITSESSTTALTLSLKTAGASTALCLPLGVPMALVLARDGRSAVLITHDLLDVLTHADRVLVLETGQIVETRTTATVLAIPRSRFGARFAGLNLVGGTARRWRADDTAGARRSGRRVGGGAVQPIGGRRIPRHTATNRTAPLANTVEVTVAELDSRGAVIRCEPTRSPTACPGWPPTSPLIRRPSCDWRQAIAFTFSVKAQEVTVHLSP
jgi:molybdate transport system ATP-binding protein